MGKWGRYYYQIVRAQDKRPVKPNRERKSIGAENTFSDDLTSPGEMLEKLGPIVEKVITRLEKNGGTARTVTLKIKYNDFVQTTRSKTSAQELSKLEELWPLIQELLYQPHFPKKPVRLLGVSLSKLQSPPRELPLEGTQLTLSF